MATRGTRPKGPMPWPPTQNKRRIRAIELSKAALRLLDDARDKLDKRDHPALVALDIADAARYIESIKSLLIEAGIGTD